MYMPYHFIFLLAMGLSTVMAFSSQLWLNIWLAMEINLFCFIPMLSTGQMEGKTEAAIKYFIVQVVGSSLFLFSISVFNLSGFMPLVISTALFLKVGVFPFHFWMPAVMLDLSVFNCILMTTWQKIIPLTMFSLMAPVSSIYWVIALSSLVTSFQGINQNKMLAIMSYSSMTHSAMLIYLTSLSVATTFIYFMMYSGMTILVFVCLSYFKSKSLMGLFPNMGNTLPLFMLVVLIALGGLPPFIGFFMKVMAFIMMVKVIWMIVSFGSSSIVSLYFYLKVVLYLTFMSSRSWGALSGESKVYLLCLVGGFCLVNIVVLSGIF